MNWHTSTREVISVGILFKLDWHNTLLGIQTIKDYAMHEDEILRLIVGLIFLKFKLVIRTRESVRLRKQRIYVETK